MQFNTQIEHRTNGFSVWAVWTDTRALYLNRLHGPQNLPSSWSLVDESVSPLYHECVPSAGIYINRDGMSYSDASFSRATRFKNLFLEGAGDQTILCSLKDCLRTILENEGE